LKTTDGIFNQILQEMYTSLDKKELIDFRKSPAHPDVDAGILKDSLTLPDRAFFYTVTHPLEN